MLKMGFEEERVAKAVGVSGSKPPTCLCFQRRFAPRGQGAAGLKASGIAQEAPR